ncbi:hypothetical protein AL539_20605 [Vibrio alginolyticus]|nr:hypothetical protein AL539_20605 [Vibrio alginolyticus]EGR1564047.1 hypothetical protein [Vibrio alginolyticus]
MLKSFPVELCSKQDGHFSELKFSVNHFFKLSSSVSAWLIWLANLASYFRNLSFEALPCQRGGIIEIAITLASPFSRFF